MTYTKEQRRMRFLRRKGVRPEENIIQGIAIAAIILLAPVIITDYFSTRSDVRQISAYNSVTGVER